MSLRSALVTAGLLASAANGHMIMSAPTMFSAATSQTDNSPLTPAQYPCKMSYGFTGAATPIKAGPNKVQLKGSAIHGGGSCQISVTTDNPPTKDSKFKVIKSFIGNCPSVADAALDYNLPDFVPNGKAVLAWTWFAVLSGQPEMYMNCAPIEVSGAGKDAAKFTALPDILVANSGTTSGCKSVEGSPLKFPNPGTVVVEDAQKPAKLPTGSCGPSGPAAPASPAQPNNPAPVTPPTTPTTPGAPAAPPVVAPSVPTPPVVPANPAPIAPITPPITPPTTPTTPKAGECVHGAFLCSPDGTKFSQCNWGKTEWLPVATGTKCLGNAIVRRSSFKVGQNNRLVRKSIAFTA